MKKGIISVVLMSLGILLGIEISAKKNRKKLVDAWKMSDKHLKLFIMMTEWMRMKQEGKNLTDYIKDNGYKTIAIYGMSYVGERLLQEVQNSDIVVKYAIDKKAEEKYSNINIVSPDDDLEDVDVIIVTAISFMNEIKNALREKVSCPIISLEDILYEL